LDIPETNKLDTLSGNAPLATGDIILTEVLQGFRREKDYKIAGKLLTSVPITPQNKQCFKNCLSGFALAA